MTSFKLTLQLVMIIFVTAPVFSLAQTRRVAGSVIDSSGRTVSPAFLTMIAGKDTLKNSTDSLGRFSFTLAFKGLAISPTILQFKLEVNSMGYLPFSKIFNSKAEIHDIDLGELVLKEDPRMLKAVEIKGTAKPIIVKKDTIEYNALTYRTQPGDRVSELVKQLPGVTVDANGNVSSMGKTLTKIRVNGKDFFTGNIKEFLSQLPADLVSKVQIIDDYGDQAAFTGNKGGIVPTKMLNLVTKAGKNTGKFGNVKTELGSNRAYGLELTGNYWQDNKQITVAGLLNRADNGAGKSNNRSGELNYRDNIGKQTIGSILYDYAENRSASREESFTENITGAGSIYSNNLNQTNSGGKNHGLILGLQHAGETNMLVSSLAGSLASNTNTGLSQLDQNGLIRQDMNTLSRLSSRNPTLNANLQYSRRFKKAGRSLSVTITGNLAFGNNQNYLEDKISYYDSSTGSMIKDSLLNRLADTRSKAANLQTMISYKEPLGKNSEGITRSVGLIYNSFIQSSNNSLETSISNSTGNYAAVDSLSNSYRSIFLTQAIRASYGYASPKIDYELGAAIQASSLSGRQQDAEGKVKSNNVNLLPVFVMSVRPVEGQTLMLIYSGSSTLPEFTRLQPLPDTRNLQNITIGNPELKAAFLHSLVVEYNRTIARGITLQLSANGSTISNKVVSNTILLPDTLGSLKRETRFVNANGNYNYNGRYSLSVPFGNNKYIVEFPGSLGYSKDVFFAENIMGFSKGINFMQGLNFRASNKKTMLNFGANYRFNANRYTLGGLNPGNIKTWLFNSDARFIVTKNFRAGIQITKTINKGYAFEQPNPLIINMDIEQMLFKNKGSIKLQAFDLLDQGNNLKRVFSGNTIADSRTNQLTRYFQLNMTYRLDQFGRKRD